MISAPPLQPCVLLVAFTVTMAGSAFAQNGSSEVPKPAASTGAAAAPAAPAASPANVPAAKKSLLVMDLTYGEGITKDNAYVMTQEVATVMAKDKRLRVQTLEDSRVTLGLETQKQMVGCIDKSCLAEIAQAIGTDTLLFGRLDRIGSQVTLQLTLLESNNAQPLARMSAKDKDVASLLGRMNAILVEAKNELNPPQIAEPSPGLSSLFYGGLIGVGAGAVVITAGAIVAGYGLSQMANQALPAKDRELNRSNFFFPGLGGLAVGGLIVAGAAVVTTAGLFE